MSEPLRILPPPELPEWMERQASMLEDVKAERERWTGRPMSTWVAIGQAVDQLAQHKWRPTTTKRFRRSKAEKEAYADQLRQNMTPAEQRLWEWLRGFELDFAPQVVVGGWIADFFSADLALVIEVDGSIHERGYRIAQDRERDRSLNEQGYRVIHITNREVLAGNFEKILLASE